MPLRRSMKAFVRVSVGFVAAGTLAALVLFFVYGETNGTLVSSGETRHYLLYIPKSYNPAAGNAACHQPACVWFDTRVAEAD